LLNFVHHSCANINLIHYKYFENESCFNITDLISVVLGNKEYIVLLIKSKELENLRKLKGLSINPTFKNCEVQLHAEISWVIGKSL